MVSVKVIISILFFCLICLLANSLEHNNLYLLQSVLTLWLIFSLKNNFSSFLMIFSVLFILGNWLKVTMHKLFDYPFVEPHGDFVGTVSQWNEYYKYSIVITVGIIFFKYFVDFFPKKNTYNAIDVSSFSSNKNMSVIGIAFLLIIYLLNWKFGFYRIGVGRELHLPFGLDAPVSFLVFIGAPILLSVIATDLLIRKMKLTKTIIFLVGTMSLIASTTIYSRASSLLIMLPILFGLNKTVRYLSVTKSSLKLILIVTGITLIFSILLVSIIRSYVYAGDVTSQRLGFYLLESVGLVFDRWIGAESIMTSVTSAASPELFFSMLVESPSIGVDGIYQKLSDSHYVALDNMTFLTLPGALGILTFSGNIVVVFVGVILICTIGFTFELFTKINFKKYYALEFLIVTNLAYHFSQMVFPALFIPFIVQLTLFLFFIKYCFIFFNKKI